MSTTDMTAEERLAKLVSDWEQRVVNEVANGIGDVQDLPTVIMAIIDGVCDNDEERELVFGLLQQRIQEARQ